MATTLLTLASYHLSVREADGAIAGQAGALARSPQAPTDLVAKGAVWSYHDDGSDLGTSWRGANFADTTWKSGPAPLGFGGSLRNPPAPEATVVNGGPAADRFITTYFRRSFVIRDPALLTNLILRVQREDGAVVYLNGTEVFRSNMPVGPVSFGTLATSDAAGDSQMFYSSPVDPKLLVPGTNVLAVEVHQSSRSGSDLRFDLALTAQPATGFTITSPSQGDVFCAGTTHLITWTGGNATWNVDILLVDVPSWTVFSLIAGNTPNDGSEVWNIPAALPPSSYLIYIQEVGQTTWTYGGTFTVTAPLALVCPANKTVACDADWTFDPPKATSCCGTGVTISVLSTVTNGVSPMLITRTWQATDACGSTNTCSQTVTQVGTNLVVNGSFEATSPAVAPNTSNNSLDPATGLPGWTTTPGNFLEVWSNNAGFPASLGTNQLEINAQSTDQTVSQVVSGLSTNCPATFCFDYTGRFRLADGTYNNDFTVALSGGHSLLVSFNPATYGVGGWTNFCVTFVPTAPTITIAFRGQPHSNSGTVATQGGAHIDNVSLTQCCAPHAAPCVEPNCITFESPSSTNGFTGYLPCQFSSPGVALSINSPGPSNATNDYYLHARDLSGASLVQNFSAFNGNYLCLASNRCTQFCFDFRLFIDGDPSHLSVTPSFVLLSDSDGPCGTNAPIRAQWVASFAVTEDGGTNAGWHRLCAPIRLVENGNLPSSAQGHWQMLDGRPNSDWDLLLASVTGLQLPIDFTSNPAEEVGYDNFCFSSSECCAPVPANLALWLPLDETSGSTSANLFAGGNNGTRINAPSVNTGYVSNSLCFDGVSQYVSVPDYPAINPGANDDFSIDAWVKRDLNSGNSPPRVIVDKRDPQTIIGYSLAVSFGNLVFQMSTPSSTFTNYRDTGIVPADGRWHFVAVTVSRISTNGGRFYIDGNPTGTFDPTPHLGSLSTTNAFLVGTTPIGGAAPWMGCIDEVEFFRRAITAQEVREIFNAGAAGKCKTPCSAPPVLICAKDKTVPCGSAWSFDPPSPSDTTCGTDFTITVVGTVTNGVCPQVITRTWQATDCCNNTTKCSQTVTVVDNTPPELLCAASKTVACGTDWTFDLPSVKDACCGTAVKITVADTVTNGVCPQVITRTWLATDCCNNISKCTQTVTVVDNTPPELLCAANKTVACGTDWTFDLPTFKDACCGADVKLTILGTVTNGVCPQVITRTWEATDCCNNATKCSQTVTVVDNKPPELLCSPSKTVVCGTAWTFDRPSVKDACCGTNITLTFSTVTNSTSPLVITRTWKATDCCDNTSTCSQTVTVPTDCCVTLSNECVRCAPDGSYTYSFDLRNDSGQTAYSVLLAEVGGNPVFATPLIYLSPPLPTGQTRNLSVTINSTDCGPLCFYVVPHTETFEDCCSVIHCITLPNCCPPRTYTTTPDFNEGVLLNLTNSNGQLCFPDHITPFPYINIACTDRGTMVRIDTGTGALLGEYRTAPGLFGLSKQPSRTTVDRFGNVWLANRAESSGGKGSVTRIALVIGGTRCDSAGVPQLNGQYLKPPFIYNSGAIDRDGDGLLKTSFGPGNVLPWDNAAAISVDNNGGVTAAEDELIINYARTSGTGARTMAVDKNNDLWVGGFLNKLHEKLSGITALPVPATLFIGAGGSGGYGGLIDGAGFLWSSGRTTGLIRHDTTTLAGSNLGPTGGNYGLAIDPCTGNVWHDNLGVYGSPTDTPNKIFVHSPSGALIGSLTGYAHGAANAQGCAVDDRGNVWVAHSILGNPNSVGRLTTAGTFIGNVPLPVYLGRPVNGPTGVAVDSNGKVWVSNYSSHTVMRIDPNNPSASPAGTVDLIVDLNYAGQTGNAGPYNYSDKTGYSAIGVTNPSGFWDVIHDACTDGADWGKLSWTVSPGTVIKVEVRAADSVLALPTKPWKQVKNGLSFCGTGVKGRHLEIRVTLFKEGACLDSKSCLYDLTVQCCRPLSSFNSLCDIKGPPHLDWTEAIKICDPAPFTTNLTASIIHPGGLPMQVSFYVNGANIQRTNIPAGTPPTRAAIDFVHTYQPGSNNVELVIADLVNDTVIRSIPVIIGDTLPPEWGANPSRATNAFTGVIPLFQPVLVDDCANLGEIVITQEPRPGTVVGPGASLVTLTASDRAGHRSVNLTAFTVSPVLSITSPRSYEQFLTTTNAPVTLQIASTATDVARVNYYLGSNLVATATSAPFGTTLVKVPAGAYALTAEAVNSSGLTSRSEPVLVFFGSSEPARIDFTRTATGLVMTWSDGRTLQSADHVLGPWKDVPDAKSPFDFGPAATNKFFRVR